MLIPFLEKLVIKIFEAGQKKSFFRKKEMLSSGFYLGRSPKLYNRLEEENIFIPPNEMKGHRYIIGSSGSGKTNLIENFICSDILQNRGICILDGHGDISQKITVFLSSIWQNKTQREKEDMARRLILVEPFRDRITGFNPLEANSYSAALQMMRVFKARWPDIGVRTEELLRSCLVTLSANNLTLLELPLLLTNREMRKSLVKNLANDEIKSYWLDRYDKLSSGSETQWKEAALNKITEFLTDENIRYMLGQKSTLDFRKAMDRGCIVILNVSKGQLENASLLGGLFLFRLQRAALSRADIPVYQRRAFYLYLDEVQNFLNGRDAGDIETLLSESRKYNLHLAAMAHQNLAQLDNSLLNAVLGNISALFCFRLGYRDALTLAPELDPLNKNTICNDLIKLGTGEAYFKIKWHPARLVKIPLSPQPYVHPEVAEEFKKSSLSFSTRPLVEVKKEIEERQRKLQTRKPADNYPLTAKNPLEGQDGW